MRVSNIICIPPSHCRHLGGRASQEEPSGKVVWCGVVLCGVVSCGDGYLEATLEVHEDEDSLGVHGMDGSPGCVHPVAPACLHPSMLNLWRHCRYQIRIPNTSHSTAGPCMCMCMYLLSPQLVSPTTGESCTELARPMRGGHTDSRGHAEMEGVWAAVQGLGNNQTVSRRGPDIPNNTTTQGVVVR